MKVYRFDTRTKVFLVFVIAVMVMIFTLSQMSGNVSHILSDFLANLLGITRDDAPSASPLLFGLSLRKWAHVGAFWLLGVAMTLFYLSLVIRRTGRDYVFAALVSFFTSVSYAGLDELHQFFVPDRHAQLKDVGIDAIGALTAVLTVTIIWYSISRMRIRARANKT